MREFGRTAPWRWSPVHLLQRCHPRHINHMRLPRVGAAPPGAALNLHILGQYGYFADAGFAIHCLPRCNVGGDPAGKGLVGEDLRRNLPFGYTGHSVFEGASRRRASRALEAGAALLGRCTSFAFLHTFCCLNLLDQAYAELVKQL
jgi:hypothetical protein